MGNDLMKGGVAHTTIPASKTSPNTPGYMVNELVERWRGNQSKRWEIQ